MDMVIYTTESTLEHRQDGGIISDYYYWHFRRPPKNFKVGDKVHFATNKLTQGYFTACTFNPDDHEETIVWNKNTWIDLKDKIPTKSFRGFRYKWW
jgi:hypothetical protein